MAKVHDIRKHPRLLAGRAYLHPNRNVRRLAQAELNLIETRKELEAARIRHQALVIEQIKILGMMRNLEGRS